MPDNNLNITLAPEQILEYISSIALRIYQSLDINEILNTTVAEVRQVLNTDRVLIYQLNSDGGGVVAVESVGCEWMSLKGIPIYDSCFQKYSLESSRQGHVETIVDIDTADLNEDYRNLLIQFQVKAKLVVPILQNEQTAPSSTPPRLWGLLIVHHCAGARQWQPGEMDFLQQLTTHVGIAIQKAELHQQLQKELAEHRRAETALQNFNEELETRVIERTTELRQINEQLHAEIVERLQVQKALQESQLCSRLVNTISTARTAGLGIEEIIDRTVKRIHQFFRNFGVAYCTFEGENQIIVSQCIQPPVTPSCTGLVIDITAVPKYLTNLQSGIPLIVDDITCDEVKCALPPVLVNLIQNTKIAALLAVPLLFNNRLLGLLSLTSFQVHYRWSEYEIGTIIEIADYLSLTLQEAYVQEKRQKAEMDLRESKELFRSAFDHAAIGMALVGIDGYWLKYNNLLCEILGYSESELGGITLQSITHPDDLDDVLNFKQQLLADEVSFYHREKRLFHKLGHLVWVYASISLVRDAIGLPLYFIAQIQDITARKQAENEAKVAEENLRSSEEHFRRIVDTATEGIWVIDAENKTSFVNKKMADMLGYSVDFFTNKSLFDFMNSEGQIMAQTLLEPRRQGIEEQHDFKFRRADGSELWAIVSTSAFLDDEGRYTGALGMVTDITERKRAEEELAKARDVAIAATKTKSEFLATMSHEIRTPMNAVIGMTGLLLETELTPQQRNFTETIRSSGEALLTLINDILDFSKIESGKLELEEHPFDLREAIESSFDLLANEAAAKGLELAYILDAQTPNTIVGDFARLRQILVNLLSNAIKFTEAGEVVVSVTVGRFQVKPENENIKDKNQDSSFPYYEIQFAIKDTGIGIPADRMDRLFKSFSQVDSSTSRQYGGTGLGLAISKYLSEMMGGRIWVESGGAIAGNHPPNWGSLNPSGGSTFYFTIVAPVIPSCSLFERDVDLRQLTQKRLLIVVDNATNSDILTIYTQSWGMITKIAVSGVEALDWLRKGNAVDLAILDMQMPQMDVLSLAKEIRSFPNLKALPLVLLTGLEKPKTVKEVEQLELAAFLNKPIKQSQLYDVLNSIFAEVPIKLQRKYCPLQTLEQKKVEPHPLRILLAEDNRVNQQVALHLLEQIGYRADIAANGLEVLAALHMKPYDVVLMDVQMPLMDGLEATKRICQEWSSKERPRIIAVTANAMQGDKEECLRAGMDDYISKPIRVNALAEALTKLQHRGEPNSVQLTSPGAEGSPTPPLPAREWGLGMPLCPPRALENPTSYPSPESSSAIDIKILASFCNAVGRNNSARVGKLIDCYLTEAPELLQNMKKALLYSDVTQLQRIAHSLKSSSAAIGANHLANFCKELEAMSRAGTIADAPQKVVQIKNEYERVKAALQINISIPKID